jgi:hypothetical protein
MKNEHNSADWLSSKANFSEESSTIQPDALLTSQVRPRANVLYRSEWLLLWAVLSDALHVISVFHPSRPGRSSKENRQWETDVAWVRAEDAGPMSFVYICDHLGLDRQAVRQHVEHIIADPEAGPKLDRELSHQAA